MKKFWLIFLILAGVVIFGYYLAKKLPSKDSTAQIAKSQCQVSEMTFYYSDQCTWCQKVKSEGTITKIEQLGIKVKEINAAVGPIRHKFQGVPTFVINEKVYTGYKTFEELKGLLGCLVEASPPPQTLSQAQAPKKPAVPPERAFFGDKGDNLILENGELKIDALLFPDNQTRFYNVKMPDNKTIYFFVVKDRNGIYRAAANACQVCFTERKGFHQEGDEIVCNNCGNRYPMEKIATEKGGCNPGPINPNLEIREGKIIINQSDLEKVSELF